MHAYVFLHARVSIFARTHLWVFCSDTSIIQIYSITYVHHTLNVSQLTKSKNNGVNTVINVVSAKDRFQDCRNEEK